MTHLRTLLFYSYMKGETEAKPRECSAKVTDASWVCQTVTATQPTWYTALRIWITNMHVLGIAYKHTIYGCRIHSHAFIQPFFMKFLNWCHELLILLYVPERLQIFSLPLWKWMVGMYYKTMPKSKIFKIQHGFYNRYTLQ